MDAKRAAEILRATDGERWDPEENEAALMGASALERLPEMEKERDKLLDVLQSLLGVSHGRIDGMSAHTSDIDRVMRVLVKHGRLIRHDLESGETFEWAPR